MPRDKTPLLRRRTTVRGRLVVAALQLLLPIFALGVLGFVQLDHQAERAGEVAAEAAEEMGVVDSLLANLDAADAAGHEYLDGQSGTALIRFNLAASKVDAGLAKAVRLDDAKERRLGRLSADRWGLAVRRVRLVQALHATGRPISATFDDAHDADMTAIRAASLGVLSLARNEIGEQAVAEQRERQRDRTLLVFPVVVGALIAAWVIIRLARDIVRPLARLGVAADRLRAGRHSERVEIDGPAELARVGATFNVMAATVEAHQTDLRRLAFYDALTGLPNRAAFTEQVESAAAGDCVALVLVGLDDFKSVNDALGHAAGDELLVEVAGRIGAVVGTGGTVARMSGDNFAVLLRGREVEALSREAVRVADELLERILAPLTIAEVRLVPGASAGISVGPADAASRVREADAALHEAKRAGRGRHARFEPSMQQAASRRLAVIADLRQAIERDEFRLLYQPIVDLPTRSVRATEALVRWEHPVRGLVSPGEFIPLAEQTGLIVAIGRWVLRTACVQAAEWQRSRPDAGRSMTVNLSTRQLLEPDLVDEVATALRLSGLPPENLVLEITESAVMADPKAASLRLGELRRLGVRLAIDDFGTGHSSLAYLRELPVHDLKIAREFVAVMEENPNDLALVRGILALGHGLGLRVVAEGIETDEQNSRLLGMGCDLGQGYLYARPLEADAVPPMIDAVHATGAPNFVASTTVDDPVLRAALRALPDVALLTFDLELRATMVAGDPLERLGWRPEDWEGKLMTEVLPAARAEALERLFRAALHGERQNLDWRTMREGRRMRVDVGPLRNGAGAVTGGLLVARYAAEPASQMAAVRATAAGAQPALAAPSSPPTRPIRPARQARRALRP